MRGGRRALGQRRAAFQKKRLPRPQMQGLPGPIRPVPSTAPAPHSAPPGEVRRVGRNEPLRRTAARAAAGRGRGAVVLLLAAADERRDVAAGS
jgi:hypothetical protein